MGVYVVVGASQGIGYSIAEQLSAAGHRVLNFSRNDCKIYFLSLLNSSILFNSMVSWSTRETRTSISFVIQLISVDICSKLEVVHILQDFKSLEIYTILELFSLRILKRNCPNVIFLLIYVRIDPSPHPISNTDDPGAIFLIKKSEFYF